ncbi:Alpha/Beta hydrolase protein [Gigaspora rosea]|uniref:Alpha/Beta hydrolase protein n=1 Tax=Gigaspora rosea TaxID=44941 RepID=A0A397VQ21_9GLOM|nr:Alpha/Beta hydrolase protein [Gigaspora rosea]
MSLSSIQRIFLQSIAAGDPEGHFVDVDNIQTYYKIAIPQHHQIRLQNQQPLPYEPHKPVILCLHHFLGNQYTWKFLMQPIADATGCHVIAYDRVAFGFTERPDQWEEGKNPYTQSASVEFAIQLLIQLGYGTKKVVLIGCSTGSAISCSIAIRYPDLVHSLILIGPSLRPDDQGPPPVARHILGSSPGRLFLKAILYRYLPLTTLYHDVHSMREWETVVKPCYRVPLTLPNFYDSVSWLIKYFIPFEILPNKQMLHQFPILYITGDDDKYLHVDKHKEIFDEMVEGAPENAILEHHVIENCGHLTQDEKPQETLDLIIDFLRRLDV